MRQSTIPFKTRKEAPKDEVSMNAKLLIKAGYIHKEMAGVYSLLPLGLRVVEKIKKIIREEMESLGAGEMSLTALQDKNLWIKTNRWSDDVVDNWFKTSLKNGSEIGLGFTHEEPLTALLKDHVSSYKDLPFALYQFQTKFRNELRAKSGIMRGREFLMKDLYSFSSSDEEHDAFYQRVRDAYIRIFERVGLGHVTYPVYASGGTFSKFSLEFQTLTDAGEDLVYLDKNKKVGINQEIYSEDICKELGLNMKDLEEVKTVEVGNIFNLGTKFSDPLELNYKDEKGDRCPVVMGSYGIGIGRLMGVIAEVYGNENGLNWPKEVAPFDVHIIAIGDGEAKYKELKEKGVEVLLDDRNVSAKTKYEDAVLIGIKEKIVIK